MSNGSTFNARAIIALNGCPKFSTSKPSASLNYLDENGKLVTESLRDFTKTALKKRFASLDDFLKRWKSAERKQE